MFALMMLLILSVLACCVLGKLIRDGGEIQLYGHDSDVAADGMNVLVIGVGTAMSANDYGKLCNKIANTAVRTLVAMVDSHCWLINPIKLCSGPFADKFKAVQTLIKELSFEAKSWFIGGHSAAGSAASYALIEKKLVVTSGKLAGYIGFDPFQFKGQAINIPTLIWAFEKPSCFVDLKGGGAGFFNGTASYPATYGIKNNYLYTLKEGYQHCIFSDKGCIFGLLCGAKSEEALVKAHAAIAQSIRLFVQDGSAMQGSPMFSVRAVEVVKTKARVAVNA